MITAEDFSQYVHTVVDHQGRTRYVVAQWRESAAQYWVPLRADILRTDGMQSLSHAMGRRLRDIWTQGYSYTRRDAAVRRAREIYDQEVA